MTTTSSPIRTEQIIGRRSHLSVAKVTTYRFYVGTASWGEIEGTCSTGTDRTWTCYSRSGKPIGSFASKAEAVAFMTERFGR